MNQPTGLAEWWSELAGKQASVAFSEVSSPPDRALDEELQNLRSVFADPAISTRYFDQPKFTLDSRAAHWAGSRRCLVSVLKDLFARGAKPSDIRMTLSHSVGMCLAAAVVSPSCSGIGVDLEKSDREISEMVAARFHFQSEIELGVSALEAWVIKEACFKAELPEHQRVVWDYRITSLSEKGWGEAHSIKNDASRFRFGIYRTNDSILGFSLRR